MAKLTIEYYPVYLYGMGDRGMLRFKHFVDAQAYANSKGEFYTAQNTRITETIVVFESLQEAEVFDMEQKRRAALAKLNDEERMLLGL